MSRPASEPARSSGPRSRDELLAAAAAIVPLIEAQAEANEAAGDLTQETAALLKAQRLYHMYVPAEAGGDGADILTAIELVEMLTRADGSTGWCLMANSLLTGGVAACIGEAGLDALFGGPEPAILAGQVGPIGTARKVEDGLVGQGRFQFNSGSSHASHVGCGFQLTGEDGQPLMRADGQPEWWVGFVPRADMVFRGNWDVMGMTGTGSFDLDLPETFIPAHLTLDMMEAKPRRGRRGFAIGLYGNGYAGHSAVALGLMARALAEVAKIAPAKARPGYPGPTGDYPLFLHQFALREAQYRGMRAYVHEVYGAAEQQAARDGALSAELHARMVQAAVAAHNTATEVVQFCHLWAGTASLRNPSTLGRTLRDLMAATQHFLVDQKMLVDSAPPILASWRG
jgi:alkylation response protein AidB-like acyl-CoA dehydrogenase